MNGHLNNSFIPDRSQPRVNNDHAYCLTLGRRWQRLVKEDRHEYGVGFLVYRDMVSALLGWQTDLNPPEQLLSISPSYRFMHQHLDMMTVKSNSSPRTPGNYRPNTKEGHSGCTRGLEC